MASMNIRYINVNGGGFSGPLTVEEGTTAGQLFHQKMSGQSRGQFHISINNRTAKDEQVIMPNDMVAITPAKFDGGAFGSELIGNLRLAAQLGQMARENPDLPAQLQAVNQLGTMLSGMTNLAQTLQAVNDFGVLISNTPDLAANLNSLMQFISAVGGSSDATGAASVASASLAPEPLSAEPAAPSTEPDSQIISSCVRLSTGTGLGHDEPLQPNETLVELFNRVMPNKMASDYKILVNGGYQDADYVLQPGVDSIEIRLLPRR